MDYAPSPAERSRQRHIVLEALNYQPSQSEARTVMLRAFQALLLSPTPEVWSQLLRGNAVPTDQLDHHTLRRAMLRRVK